MAKKKHDTWMPLYVGDYLKATMGLNTEQHGAYLLLIMAAWQEGGALPNDSTQLAAYARLTADKWASHEPILSRYFAVTADRWTHERVQEELARAKEMVETKRRAGGLGAANKWGLSVVDPSPQTKRSQRLAAARQLGTHTADEWEALIEVCGGVCVRCGGKPHPEPVKDHITPIYQGGSDAIANLQPLCRSCNSSKGPDCTDHRPSDWVERLARRLAERVAERVASY
jgi:uncharacterized protein YdaU (DUF1376 family)